MNELEAIKDAVLEKLPNLEWDLDLPDNASASSWLDLNLGDNVVTIEWKPTKGFGLYLDDDESYGSKPNEVYRTAERLLSRIDLLIQHKRTLRMREIRELLDLSQEELGKFLGQKQASISKIESRSDIKFTTLLKYISALGGRVEIKAHFDDCDVTLAFSDQDDANLLDSNNL